MKNSSFFGSIAILGMVAFSATALAAGPDNAPRHGAASSCASTAPAPQASVTLHFAGAERISIDGSGGLEILRADGNLRHYRPALYQNLDGKRAAVHFSYHVVDSEHVQLKAVHADPTVPLEMSPLGRGRTNS